MKPTKPFHLWLRRVLARLGACREIRGKIARAKPKTATEAAKLISDDDASWLLHHLARRGAYRGVTHVGYCRPGCTDCMKEIQDGVRLEKITPALVRRATVALNRFAEEAGL